MRFASLAYPHLGELRSLYGSASRPRQNTRPEPSLLRQPKDNDVGDALRFACLPPLRLASLAIWLGLRPPQNKHQPYQ